VPIGSRLITWTTTTVFDLSTDECTQTADKDTIPVAFLNFKSAQISYDGTRKSNAIFDEYRIASLRREQNKKGSEESE